MTIRTDFCVAHRSQREGGSHRAGCCVFLLRPTSVFVVPSSCIKLAYIHFLCINMQVFGFYVLISRDSKRMGRNVKILLFREKVKFGFCLKMLYICITEGEAA